MVKNDDYDNKNKDETYSHIAIFNGKSIRRKLIDDKWYFSIIDIIAVLTDSSRPRKYWSELKIKLLEGCAAVYCQAIGASAIKQIIAQGIQPVKVHEGSRIKNLVADLQYEMKSGATSWLAKAINQNKTPDPKRFDEMAQEDWQE